MLHKKDEWRIRKVFAKNCRPEFQSAIQVTFKQWLNWLMDIIPIFCSQWLWPNHTFNQILHDLDSGLRLYPSPSFIGDLIDFQWLSRITSITKCQIFYGRHFQKNLWMTKKNLKMLSQIFTPNLVVTWWEDGPLFWE